VKSEKEEETMPRTWWEIGISAVLLFILGLSVNCALDVGGLGPGIMDIDGDLGKPNAYTCNCDCSRVIGNIVAPLPPSQLNVCGDTNDIGNDCAIRVKQTFQHMLDVCEPGTEDVVVTCQCTGDESSKRFATECNDGCMPVEVVKENGRCVNFDPENGNVTANLPPLILPPNEPVTQGDLPVCLVSANIDASSDFAAAQAFPTASPTPLAAGIFGQRSMCTLDPAQSTAIVTIDNEQPVEQPHVNGVVEFLGTPCPGASCAVGMAYQLSVDPFTFSGFCGGTTISDVHAMGSAAAEAVVLDAAGVGEVAEEQTLTSARGTRIDSGCIGNQELQMSFVGTNVDPLGVTVNWDQKTCEVTGSLLGASVENSNVLSVEVSLYGTLVNQPPIAQAGAEQTVECTSLEGTEITLDGTGSSDPDNNIAVVQWQEGSRGGPLVGDALQVTLPQGVSTTAQYVLRVIDASAQADEDTTTVQVVDTSAPSISTVTATPNVLGPPNHKMVPVTVAVAVTDACDPLPSCQLTSVSSNEPVDGQGDGNTAPDWEMTGPLTVNLRAELAGGGSGRIYELTVACSDATGNETQGTTTVTVPHGNK
jgi:hypothetical protein